MIGHRSKKAKASRLSHCLKCGSDNIVLSKIDSKSLAFLSYTKAKQIECKDCLAKFRPLKEEKDATFFGPIPFLTKICPKCHNKNLYKSSKKAVWDRALSYVGLNSYRCSNCYTRFYLFKTNLIKRGFQIATLVIVLILGAYFTYSFKKGKDDQVELQTKTNSSLSEVTQAEAEEQVNNVAALEKKLQKESSANIPANNTNEVSYKGLEITPVEEKAVPLAHELPEQAAALEESFDHIKKEVSAFIDGWLVDWQNSAGAIGNMDSYLDNYAEDFSSNGIPKEKWQQKKRKNNSRKNWIRVALSDVKVEKADKNMKKVKVSFKQDYKSSNYSDVSSKVLILRQEENRWLIYEEITAK